MSMIKRADILVSVLMSAAILTCCRRTAPQAPSNHVRQDDPAVAMMIANMRLAEEADRVCTDYVKQSGNTFTLDETRCWYQVTGKNEAGRQLAKGDVVELMYSVFSLADSTMIEDTQLQLEVGKRETLPCFDYMLPEFREGEQGVLVVPYYQAYGKEGNDKVPALTNCMVKINKIKIITRNTL